MSRYEKNLGKNTLSVGWDRPMNTFFAQVHTNQADDDLRDLSLVLWLGQKNNEWIDVARFAGELAAKGYVIEKQVAMHLVYDAMDETAPLPLPEGWVKKL